MRLIKSKAHAILSLPSLRLEGALFLPDQLEKAALGNAGQQTEADYQTPKGLKLKDDYSRAFQIACAQWRHFAGLMERQDADPARVTTDFVRELLRDALGYHTLSAVAALPVGERHYPITWLAGGVPLVIAPHNLGLDDLDPRFAIVGSGSRKKSAFQLAQEFLNASPEHLWAIVSNGRQLRLLRDAATLTRPSFLEFDLQDLLAGQRFAEFAMAWRLLHASRAPRLASAPSGSGAEASCIWEAWRAAGQEEGTRVREGLRVGVTQALLTLGSGFLRHPANEALRQGLQQGHLSQDAYFQQLLRLVYRLIFLFTVEERGLLHPADASPSALAARRAYAEGYALARLRDRALRRRARTPFDDLWQGVRILFKGLDGGEPRLALPALGGLFAAGQCPALDAASLTNADLLAAVQYLRWDHGHGTLAPVDYRNMGPEELGSVYESLLELVPDIDLAARQFGFVGVAREGGTTEAIRGNARKTSGSYYTPDALVQELIKSALDPVIAQRLAANPANPIAALLAIRVIDPACGSGHFLLAAARRLAEHLAALRSPEGAVKPLDYRHALREVIGRCLFGVDRNPMALELCRTALWLEGFEEGRPLSFLDHHLQCGDALLGLTDLKALEAGIPSAAFKPLSGDDKGVCQQLTKDNKLGLKQLERDLKRGQQLLRFDEATGLSELQALEALPDATPADIAAREAAYGAFLARARDSRLAHAADLLLGAFVLPKTEASAGRVPTSQTLYLELFSETRGAQQQAQLAAARAACREARVLHWPLVFPQVFSQGGFDCVLGNPPWERIKLQEEEFFATRGPLVAEARNKAERGQRIDWLAQGQLARNLYPHREHSPAASAAEQRLYQEFLSARRTAEAASLFAHLKGEEGGRYPLTGVGDVNTYALFAETISQIVARQGRAGFIVPTGIATDDSTKAYFGHLAQSSRLVSLYDFENREAIFPGVHRSYKFCLLTLGAAEQAEFVCFALQVSQLADPRRRFTLMPDEIELLSPVSGSAPVFRSNFDKELTLKISKKFLPFFRAWDTGLAQGTFHSSADSHLFLQFAEKDLAKLYEPRMFHQYDHRYSSFVDGQWVKLVEKKDPIPRYFVKRQELKDRLGANDKYSLVYRRVSRNTDERTLISCVIPTKAINENGVLVSVDVAPPIVAGLLANLNSLVIDYQLRQKDCFSVSNADLRSLSALPPETYTETDLAFILPRVLELTYTARDLRPWAQDLGYDGEPFPFDPERRAQLRAELDAWYARAYGLTRDELRYILDPADLEGPDYPSETFRVLQKNELREFGEYRTRRLVLAAWDRLQSCRIGTDDPLPQGTGGIRA